MLMPANLAFNIVQVIVNIHLITFGKEKGLKWYSYSGHLEKCVIRIKLLEVQNDNEEKELFETI